MKESYQKLIQNITHFFVRKSVRRAPIKATKSWLFSIVFSSCLVIFFCGVGVYTFFFSANREVSVSNTPTSTALFFSDARVDVVVEQYRSQIALFEEKRYSAPLAPDTGMVADVVGEVSGEDGGEGGEGLEAVATTTSEM